MSMALGCRTANYRVKSDQRACVNLYRPPACVQLTFCALYPTLGGIRCFHLTPSSSTVIHPAIYFMNTQCPRAT